MIDDDDFDLMGGTKGSTDELSSLLADVHAETQAKVPQPALPSLARASEPFATSDRRKGSDRREAPRSVRPPPPASAPEEPDSLYGLPGSAPWEQAAYAIRVLRIGTRAKERAALLLLHVGDSDEALGEAHAALGRAAHDSCEVAEITLPDAELVDIRDALASLDAIAASQAEVDRHVRKQAALASARREAAAATLDPTQVDQDQRLAALDAAEKHRDACKIALEAAEGRLREAAREGADALRAVDSEIDRARNAVVVAEQRRRDAALAYAEARRRALLQVGRVVEADQAVEGLRAEEKRAARDAERRKDVALRALREGYVKLGIHVFEGGVGVEQLMRPHAVVRRIREERERTLSLAAKLRDRARAFDPTAYEAGKKAIYALGAGLVVLMLLAAALA